MKVEGSTGFVNGRNHPGIQFPAGKPGECRSPDSVRRALWDQDRGARGDPAPITPSLVRSGRWGLDETLSDEDATFTDFASTNSAFENTDDGELTDDSGLLSEVLEYHVVSGQAIEEGDIEDRQPVEGGDARV